eukprot:8517512-Karenia_brevis.AAC.1
MAAYFKADVIQLQNRPLTLETPLNQESPRVRVEDEGDASRRREDRQETRGRGRGDGRRRGDDSPVEAAAVESREPLTLLPRVPTPSGSYVGRG